MADLAIHFSTVSTEEEELVDLDNNIHLARLEMDDELNSKLPHGFGRVPKSVQFNHKENLSLETMSLINGKDMLFKRVEEELLAEDEVEIQVKGAGVTAFAFQSKKSCVLSHTIHLLSFLTDFDIAGNITRKGQAVDHDRLRVGDFVIAPMISDGRRAQNLRNKVHVKNWECIRLRSRAKDALSWGSDLCAAIFALQVRAQVRPKEKVVIVGPCTNFGYLAIRVCQVSPRTFRPQDLSAH